jgi:hypothetical protein
MANYKIFQVDFDSYIVYIGESWLNDTAFCGWGASEHRKPVGQALACQFGSDGRSVVA